MFIAFTSRIQYLTHMISLEHIGFHVLPEPTFLPAAETSAVGAFTCLTRFAKTSSSSTSAGWEHKIFVCSE